MTSDFVSRVRGRARFGTLGQRPSSLTAEPLPPPSELGRCAGSAVGAPAKATIDQAKQKRYLQLSYAEERLRPLRGTPAARAYWKVADEQVRLAFEILLDLKEETGLPGRA